MTPEEKVRAFVPVEDPAGRPRKTRETVRVIMIDREKVLLFEDSDPGIADSHWWVTPGGGVDAGESLVEAATREVREETGYELVPGDLLGPIAIRHVVHGYSDQVIEQDEAFFIAMVMPFDVDVSGHTDEEKMTLTSHRWWSHDDLRFSDEWVWPHELVELWSLVGECERWPVDLGTQEESTVLDTQ